MTENQPVEAIADPLKRWSSDLSEIISSFSAGFFVMWLWNIHPVFSIFAEILVVALFYVTYREYCDSEGLDTRTIFVSYFAIPFPAGLLAAMGYYELSVMTLFIDYLFYFHEFEPELSGVEE